MKSHECEAEHCPLKRYSKTAVCVRCWKGALERHAISDGNGKHEKATILDSCGHLRCSLMPVSCVECMVRDRMRMSKRREREIKNLRSQVVALLLSRKSDLFDRQKSLEDEADSLEREVDFRVQYRL